MGTFLQGAGFLVQQGAVFVIVIHRDLCFRRGHIDILVGKDHAGNVRAAVGIHGHIHGLGGQQFIAAHLVAVGRDGMGTFLQGAGFLVQQGAVFVIVIHRDLCFRRSHIDIFVGENHAGNVRAAVGIHGHVHGLGGQQFIAGHQVAVGHNGVETLLQSTGFLVQQRAVLMVVVHRDLCFRRGHVDILISEHHAAHADSAIRINGDLHSGFAHGLIAGHHIAVGRHHIGARGIKDLLEIQLLAVDVHIHHRHGNLRHRGGGGRLRGVGRGRCQRRIGKGDLAGHGDAVLVHVDLHPIGTGQGIVRRAAGIGPDGGGLPCPALHIPDVQGLAVLSDIIHRHRHREGLKGRFLRHVDGGHIQQDGLLRLAAIHRVPELVGILFLQLGGVHLPLPGEGGQLTAPFIQQIKGVGRIGALDLQGQVLIQGVGVHLDPVGPLLTVLNRLGREGLQVAPAIRPGQVDDGFLPEIRRIRGGKAGRQQHRSSQQKSQRAVQPHGAIMSHGVFLLQCELI